MEHRARNRMVDLTNNMIGTGVQRKKKPAENITEKKHFAECSRRKINNIREIRDKLEEYFQGSLSPQKTTLKPWFAKLQICSTLLNLKQIQKRVLMLLAVAYNNFCERSPLRPTKGIFSGSGGILLCQEKLKKGTQKGNSYSFDVYVIKGLDMESMLLKDVAYSIGIIIKVKEVWSIFNQGGCIRNKTLFSTQIHPHTSHIVTRTNFISIQ